MQSTCDGNVYNTASERERERRRIFDFDSWRSVYKQNEPIAYTMYILNCVLLPPSPSSPSLLVSNSLHFVVVLLLLSTNKPRKKKWFLVDVHVYARFFSTFDRCQLCKCLLRKKTTMRFFFSRIAYCRKVYQRPQKKVEGDRDRDREWYK